MRNLKILFLAIILLSCHNIGYSQYFSAGLYSGVNFSDIHGQYTGGRWVAKPGPSQGLSVSYSFGKVFGIQSGVGLSDVYYEHRTTSFYFPQWLNNSYVDYIYYNPSVEKMDFRLMNVPLLLTATIPTVVQLRLKAGFSFSFLQDYSTNDYYYSDNKIVKYDFGYIVSSGISYPLTDRINAALNVTYHRGTKHIIENYTYRNGYTDFSLGIEYLFGKRDKSSKQIVETDTTARKKVSVTFLGGMTYNWCTNENGDKNYSSYTGPSFGFLVDFPLGHSVSFLSGVVFERKGYSMRDSSSSFFSYRDSGSPMYFVNTSITADYATVPFLLQLPFTSLSGLFISTGPYLGFKLNARTSGDAWYITRSTGSYSYTRMTVNDDLKRLINDYDIGWIFRAGLSVPVFDKYRVSLSVQYSPGFRNIINNNVAKESYSDASYSIKNRTISFTLGFTIPSANKTY